jgi:hypothetical protein
MREGKVVGRWGATQEPSSGQELPPAGVEHRFERMTIHMDLADPYRSELTCYIDGKYYRIPVIHDVFFFGLPEVAVHMDAKQVYVESGVMVVESYIDGKADRIAVRSPLFAYSRGTKINVLEILDKAIKDESEAISFYTDAYSKVSEPLEVARLLRELALEEQKHRERLEEAKRLIR